MLLSTLQIIGLGWLAAAATGQSSSLSSSLTSAFKLDSKAAKNVLESTSGGYCSPSGPIESTNCLYETVESLNTQLYPVLHKLVEYPFFRHYKVDLYRECPFWYENGFCMNRDCTVAAADESEIPEKWRAQALSAVRTGINEDSISGCYFREQDFCYIEDDANEDGQYIDLMLNPERFTGYAGDSAHNVWRAIYEENCFGLSEASLETSTPGKLLGGGFAAGSSTAGGFGFGKLSEGLGTEMVKSQEVDMCEEKRVYYRVISGLHASISIHICQEYLDQQTGEWAPNLQCFITRLATHPERLSNVYFNAVLLLRAVARAAPYLRAYDIGISPITRSVTEKDKEKGNYARALDRMAKGTLDEVLELANSRGMEGGFDETDFFKGPDALVLKEQFKSHFRNVSRIMDCVGCDKCRLWGKLQVSGIGTALKILFELDEKALDPKVNPDLLQRSEVVALFNTLHRVSESLASVEGFRKMYAETQIAEAAVASSKIGKTEAKRTRRKKITPSPPVAQPQMGVLGSIIGVVLSIVEWFRRSCRGCFQMCWHSIEKGPFGDVAHWVQRVLGSAGIRLDL